MNFKNRIERFKQLERSVYCSRGDVADGAFRYLDISVNTLSSVWAVDVNSGSRDLLVQEYLTDIVIVYLQKKHRTVTYSKNILIRDAEDGIYIEPGDKIRCKYLTPDYLEKFPDEEFKFVLQTSAGLHPIILVQKNRYYFTGLGDSFDILYQNNTDFDVRRDPSGCLFIFSSFSHIPKKQILEIEEPKNKKEKIESEMKHIGNKELMLEYIRKNGKREIEIECPDKRIYRTRLEYWGGFLDATVNFSPKLTSNFSLETLELVEDYINGKHSRKTLELWEALDYHGIPHCFEVSSINCELVDGLNHKVPTIRRRFWLYHISQSFKKDGSIFQWIAMIEPQYNDEFMKYMSEYSKW